MLSSAGALRLLLITPGFPDDERRYAPGVVDTLVALAARGHDIDVQSIRSPPAARHSSFRGLSVVAHTRGGALRRHASLLLEVRRRHAANPYDAVWALWPNLTAFAALGARQLTRRPLLVSLMGVELELRRELAYGDPRQRRVAAALRAADAITVGAAPLAARARARGWSVDVCPLGVRFADVARRAPKDGEKVVVVGDPSPVKRVPMALEAAKMISESVTSFGRTSSEHAGVLHRGFVPPAELRRTLSAHDLLVHASAHESQGIVLVEAAYAGLAIAAFDVGVARELGALGARIAIADRTSATALAEAGARAMKMPPNDPSPIAARFSDEVCAARFEDVLERVVQCAPLARSDRR